MVQHEAVEQTVVPSVYIKLFGRGFLYVEGIPAWRIVRFVERVRFCESGCWEWTGARQTNGYGAFYWDGRTLPAHRFAWIAFRGFIEPGNHLHHICKNPSCVNPDHLQQLTPGAHLLEHTPNNPVSQQAKIEVCHRGHSLSGQNLREWIDPKNGHRHRRCKTCLREWSARRYAAAMAKRQQKEERLHCRNGHPLTPENTYEWCGARQCKICHNATSAISYAKRHPAKPKPPKTHCVNGHPWIEENLYRTTRKNGEVVTVCYVCHTAGQRKSYEKRKAKYGKYWNKAEV